LNPTQTPLEGLYFTAKRGGTPARNVKKKKNKETKKTWERSDRPLALATFKNEVAMRSPLPNPPQGISGGLSPLIPYKKLWG